MKNKACGIQTFNIMVNFTNFLSLKTKLKTRQIKANMMPQNDNTDITTVNPNETAFNSSIGTPSYGLPASIIDEFPC